MNSFASHRKIGCAILIDTSGNLLLQQRDDIPGILQPGKIGLFGGHCEGNETGLQCAVREIAEETSRPVAAERFEPLAHYDGEDMEIDGDGRLVCDAYVIRGIPSEKLVITEGSLLVVRPEEIAALESKLTPLARFALHELNKRRS
jgi:8-oxo-dGTP pyrophosphatase MutT (NUDIX family)